MLSFQQCLLVTMLVWYHSVLLPAGEVDLRDVRSAVADLTGRWIDLGISLGVRKSDLDTIQSANPHSTSDCLREMLTLWLNQTHVVSPTFIFDPLCLIHYPKFLSTMSWLE